VQRVTWGRVDVDFSGCNAGELRYHRPISASEAARCNPGRVTKVAGTACWNPRRP
jgi:hypothetical protein